MTEMPFHVVVLDDYSWLVPDMARVAVLTGVQLRNLADGALRPADIGGVDLMSVLAPAMGDDLDLTGEV